VTSTAWTACSCKSVPSSRMKSWESGSRRMLLTCLGIAVAGIGCWEIQGEGRAGQEGPQERAPRPRPSRPHLFPTLRELTCPPFPACPRAGTLLLQNSWRVIRPDATYLFGPAHSHHDASSQAAPNVESAGPHWYHLSAPDPAPCTGGRSHLLSRPSGVRDAYCLHKLCCHIARSSRCFAMPSR